MADYKYALIRYIPDAQRMEPRNVGVIVQGADSPEMKLSPHAAKLGVVDTKVFGKWRDFLKSEIYGPDQPLFHPPKSSPQFLDYLRELCEGTVVLSRPLYHSVSDQRTINEVLTTLYDRLVAPRDQSPASPATHPAGRFRQVMEERRFLKRGMKRHAHVKLSQENLWMAYRQVENGELLAIDKVEVNNRIGATANEIERLPRIESCLSRFLDQKRVGKPSRFVLVADLLEEPFAEQSKSEFDAMKADLENVVDRLKGKGAVVLRSVCETEKLGKEIDEMLPEPHADQVDEIE